MGGRLDSTNVCQSQLCVVTNISFDHTTQLGNDLESIAREKAGIIKPEVPVICGVNALDAQTEIHRVAKLKNAPLAQSGVDFRLVDVDKPDCLNPRFGITGNVFQKPLEFSNLQCSLAGKHQCENALLAAAAMTWMNGRGLEIKPDDISQGLANAKFPGRYQVWKRDGLPVVRLDIAHNEAAMKALADAIQLDPDYQSASKKYLVCSICRGKHTNEMLGSILHLFDEVVFTEFQLNPRALPVHKLLADSHAVAPDVPTQTLESPQDILPWLQSDCNANDFVCISGSNFLVAEVLPALS